MDFCCSGTLSYIFNKFKGGIKFSEVVTEAKQAGYTEPDPRDDLSGTDVARKVKTFDVNIVKQIRTCNAQCLAGICGVCTISLSMCATLLVLGW